MSTMLFFIFYFCGIIISAILFAAIFPSFKLEDEESKAVIILGGFFWPITILFAIIALFSFGIIEVVRIAQSVSLKIRR